MNLYSKINTVKLVATTGKNVESNLIFSICSKLYEEKYFVVIVVVIIF